MNITAIHLVRIGDQVVVKAEIEGRWVTLIKEPVDGAFSHIIEIDEDDMERVVDAIREIESLMRIKENIGA